MSLGDGSAPLSRLTLLFCLLALAWGAGLAFLDRGGATGPLDALEGTSLDLRFAMRGPTAPPGDLVIVAIDDATAAAVGYPPPRPVLADLIRRIAAAGPKTVAVDLLLLEPGDAAEDDILAGVLAATPSVIAAAAVFAPGGAPSDPEATAAIPVASQLKWPTAAFADAARVGVANIAADPSGAARHMPMLVAGNGTLAPAFALVAAATAAGAPPRFEDEAVEVGGVRQPLAVGRHLALGYYGPGGTIPTLSAASLLESTDPHPDLAGRVVVIGATALASGDTFQTPFDGNLTGVEVLATGIGNLVAGDGLVHDAGVRRLDAIVTVLLPLLVVLLMTVGRPAVGLFLACAAVTGWLIVAYVGFRYGYWLGVVLPLVAAVPIAVAYGSARHLAGEAEAGRLSRSRDALARLQAPAVAERLSRDPDFLTSPVVREAAVLFLDLSGYTGLSERLGPQGTQAFLERFHTETATATDDSGGLLVAFLGDGAMIFFGFDEGGPPEAARALAAVPLMSRRIDALVADYPEAAGMTVRFGVHYGPVVLSRLGGGAQQSLTVAGDTVNVASRLLELAKERRAAAAATDAVFEAARVAGMPLPGAYGPLEWMKVRGRVGDLAVRFAAVAGFAGTDAPASGA